MFGEYPQPITETEKPSGNPKLKIEIKDGLAICRVTFNPTTSAHYTLLEAGAYITSDDVVGGQRLYELVLRPVF